MAGSMEILPITISSVSDVIKIKDCLDTLDDPTKGRSKAESWERLWIARQLALESLRIVLRTYARERLCKFHDWKGETRLCLSFVIIRSLMKIPFYELDIIKPYLDHVACWDCIRDIISSHRQSREIIKKQQASNSHSLADPKHDFSHNDRKINPMFSLEKRPQIFLRSDSGSSEDNDTLGISISSDTVVSMNDFSLSDDSKVSRKRPRLTMSSDFEVTNRRVTDWISESKSISQIPDDYV